MGAPGHRDFIKNMITGSSQADVALLLCPADGGSFIASIAKGDHKTGEVPGETYSEKRFIEIATEVKRILLQEGWKKEQIEKEIPILPLAGFHGENLLKKSEKMPWWKGVTVFDPTTKKGLPKGNMPR